MGYDGNVIELETLGYVWSLDIIIGLSYSFNHIPPFIFLGCARKISQHTCLVRSKKFPYQMPSAFLLPILHFVLLLKPCLDIYR